MADMGSNVGVSDSKVHVFAMLVQSRFKTSTGLVGKKEKKGMIRRVE